MRMDSATALNKPGRLIQSSAMLGVFAYPRKKVQSRISSRLENDPLPPLSVFIDNMHVDEVQIDGGGTEAVITGNMEGLREGRRSIGFQGIFYANYLQLTVLNWKTQEPCLT